MKQLANPRTLVHPKQELHGRRRDWITKNQARACEPPASPHEISQHKISHAEVIKARNDCLDTRKRKNSDTDRPSQDNEPNAPHYNSLTKPIEGTLRVYLSAH